MTLKQTYIHFCEILSQTFSHPEAKALIIRLLSDKYKISLIDIILKGDTKIQSEIENNIHDDIVKLTSHHPIQYIIGYEEFCGHKFNVTPATLIPRPETEQLVRLISEENKNQNITVLDIGTGSGAIAISLKLQNPEYQVFGWDISDAALEIAQQNASSLQADITFEKHDILSKVHAPTKFNIIVSNPPYVTEKEKVSIDKNVLDHEPHIALFVPDDNPLLFYKAIAQFAINNLNHDGKVYFEINEAYGEETIKLLQTLDFKDIKLLQDFNLKDRFVCAKKL